MHLHSKIFYCHANLFKQQLVMISGYLVTFCPLHKPVLHVCICRLVFGINDVQSPSHKYENLRFLVTVLQHYITPWHLAWPGNSPGPRSLVTPLREFPNPCTSLTRSSAAIVFQETHQHWGERTQMQWMFLPSGVRVLVWVWVLWSRLFFPVTKSWQAPSETLSGWSQTRGDTWHGHDTSVTWRGDTWHVTRPCTLPLTSQAETIPFFKYPEILDKLILKTFESLDPRPRGY